MSAGKLISIAQFKTYTRIKPETVDLDIERGLIKTETNTKGKQSIRWFGVAKNLQKYRKAKEKWESEQQYSSAKPEEPKTKVKTREVQVGDRLTVSQWSKEAGLKSPMFLTKAIADDKLFELTDLYIRNKTMTGKIKRHFVLEWPGKEKAEIIVDVLYMKKSPIEFKQKFLAEKLNAPVEEVVEEIVEEIVEPEPEPERIPNAGENLVEALAQFLFGVKKRYTELEKENLENVSAQ
ncbi:MAG: hypothetical protein V3V74_07155 [Nitrosomonadaceae bacterium]